MKISVVGLGKLGACMAAVFASKGFDVTGIDVNRNLIEAYNKGECPINETDLKAYLDKGRTHLTFTTDFSAVKDTDMTFIIVPTPSIEDGSFTNRYVLDALYEISRAIAQKQTYHLITVTSTVMPLSAKKEFIPAIERITQKTVGEEIGFTYNPEFIALGSVIKNMLTPDAILIGESDERSGIILGGFYSLICENKPPICRMSIENAECAKLMLNVAVTTKISLANTFAEVCERIPNGNIDVITDFIGKDSRIGRKYLTGGTAYGGPCFCRDALAFTRLANNLGLKDGLAMAVHNVNQNQNIRLASTSFNLVRNILNPKIAVLGLAYKTGTGITEESAGVKLMQNLQRHKVNCTAYDSCPYLVTDVKVEATIQDALMGTDLAVITLPLQSYALSPEVFKKYMRTPKVLDCWRMLNKDVFNKAGIEYHALGLG